MSGMRPRIVWARKTKQAAVVIGLVLAGVLIYAAKEAVLDRVKARVLDGLAREMAGHGLEVAEFKLSVFGGFEISGVAVHEPGARGRAAPMASIERLQGSVSLGGLLRGRIMIRELAASGVEVRVVVGEDGAVNWDALVQSMAGRDPGARPVLDRIEVERCSVSVVLEGPAPREYGLRDARLRLWSKPGGAWAGEVQDAGLQGGGVLSGALDLEPDAPRFDLELQGLNFGWLNRELGLPDELRQQLWGERLTVSLGVLLLPESTSIEFAVRDSELWISGMQVDYLKGVAVVRPDSVELKHVKGQVEGGTVAGGIAMTRHAPRRLQGSIRTFNLPVERFLPTGVTWSGTVATELVIDGGVDNLRELAGIGRVRLQNAELGFPGVPLGDTGAPFTLTFDDLRGEIVWGWDRIEINQLNFRDRGGTLSISGKLSGFLDPSGRFIATRRMSMALDIDGRGDDIAAWFGMRRSPAPPLTGAYRIALHLDTEGGELDNLSGSGELFLEQAVVFNPFADESTPEFLRQLEMERARLEFEIARGGGAVTVRGIEISGGDFQSLQLRGRLGFNGALALGGEYVIDPDRARSLDPDAAADSDAPVRFTLRGSLRAPAVQFQSP